ncbi:MAG: hypothetical protein N2036_12610, partial [Bryobacteraceae bacterium]|nr:hypothetical protein [Bryobacteraceae bacterium]
LVMPCGGRFYSLGQASDRIPAWLDEGEREFGGYDSLVLWHACPRIGVEGRNQFDTYRGMPGGLPGLRGLIQQLHPRGAKANIDYSPRDTDTRREGRNDIDALARLVAAIDAGRIFPDTMRSGATEFREEAFPGLGAGERLQLPLHCKPLPEPR